MYISLPCNKWCLTRNRKYGMDGKERGKPKALMFGLGSLSALFPGTGVGKRKTSNKGSIL